jgi:beta-glucuronidase
VSSEVGRHDESLSGHWQFQAEDAGDQWKTVTLPASFEEYEGVEFDGVGIYRKRIERVMLPDGHRAILRFEAVATQAEVWFDGERLGSHLGGWTPFWFDVTKLIRDNPVGKTHEIRVRVDEKVGHNSQGFLPVVCPHFGGIWQDVQLLTVPDTWIDDLETLAIGDATTGRIRLDLPLRGAPPQPDLDHRS